MVQLHLEDGYVMVVEAKAVDLVIVTTKRPSIWTYLKLKEFKTRVGSRKTIRKYS
jgi:hypothetical protein